jgi:hypothetical protein
VTEDKIKKRQKQQQKNTARLVEPMRMIFWRIIWHIQRGTRNSNAACSQGKKETGWKKETTLVAERWNVNSRTGESLLSDKAERITSIVTIKR